VTLKQTQLEVEISLSWHFENMAFNAKNLQYNKEAPPFLRKLRGEYSQGDGRHNVQIPRPKTKDRLKTGDGDEDEPVIVDENGERVAREDFERMVRREQGDGAETMGDEQKPGPGKDEAQEEREETGRDSERQRVAEAGGATTLIKKRKAVKVVGGEDDDDGAMAAAASGKKISKDQASAKTTVEGDENATKRAPLKAAAAKKKGKKIKLSFDEPEG